MQNISETSASINLSIDFYKIAKADLETCKLLFKKKQYPQAVFFLQQSCEKVNKAILLHSNQATVEQMYSDSHRAPKYFKRSLNNIQEQHKQIEGAVSQIPNFPKYHFLKSKLHKDSKKMIKKSIASLDKLSLHQDQILKTDLQELESYLSEIYKVKRFRFTITQSTAKKIEQHFDKNFPKLFRYFPFLKEDLKQMQLFLKNEQNRKQFFDVLIFKGIPFSIRFMKAHLTFSILAILTYPHVSTTRYPDRNTGANPLLVYQSNHPLIIKMPEIIKLLSQAFNIIDELAVFSSIPT